MQPNPIRVGVFSHLEAADTAVSKLLDIGFDHSQIAVICSDDKTHHPLLESFRQTEPQRESAAMAAAGGAVGAALGGLAAVGGIATGGTGLLFAGLAAMWIGGAAGGLVGAMSSRGVQKEHADYYDQAVADGKVVVAVEYHGDDQTETLAQAEQALQQAGAEPIPLSEG